MNSGELLAKYIEDSGKTKTYLSKKAKVSRPRLNAIIVNPSTATTSQAYSLKKELSIVMSDFECIFLQTK